MYKDFVEDLRMRRLIHQMTPDTEHQLAKELTVGYIGFDPTSDSLHIGSLSQIMTLVRFQKAGHKPIALVGGATGMVGDPSGKSVERNLLDEETLRRNLEGIKKQLQKFLDFDCGPNSAEIVNNYDWFKNYSFLNFIRDAGKHITVNYMLGKDSVKNRIEGDGLGMSFTEFSYQLIQGFDFYHLFKEKNCKLQMGGSDQWGNMTTGTEFIRKKTEHQNAIFPHAFVLTTKLITKSDGGKFGKTEKGNVWLDPEKTSPYKFYQFWLNVSDEDAMNYIRYFTLLNSDEIIDLENRHLVAPHERILQKTLAKDVTIRVHDEAGYRAAVEATEILFKGTLEDLGRLDEKMFLEVFDGVPQFDINKTTLQDGIPLIDFLSVNTQIFPSKGEARKMLQAGGVSINKAKLNADASIGAQDLINDKYILVQKGKKNYFLVKAA